MRIFLISSLLLLSTNLSGLNIKDKPPDPLEAPEGLNLTQAQAEILDPYFRNALWYYEVYDIHMQYILEVESLNYYQGQDIDRLLEEAVDTKLKNACLIVITVVSTTVTIVLAFMVKALI